MNKAIYLKGIEFFVVPETGEIFAFVDSEKFAFAELDVSVLARVRAALDKDEKYLKYLEQLDIHDPLQQIIQYIRDRFASLDGQADFDEDGPHPEFVLNSPFPYNPFGLTLTELMIVERVTNDKSEKLIASELKSSPKTINVHMVHIRRKMHAFTKAGVAVQGFAMGFPFDNRTKGVRYE